MAVTPARQRDIIATAAGVALAVPVGILVYQTHQHGLGRFASAVAEAALSFVFAYSFVLRALVRRAREKASRPDLVDVDVADTAVVTRPASDVWEALSDPTFASRLDPTVIEAVRMPSTGVGAGEVQVFLARSGESVSVTAVEVIEYEDGRFARVRPLILHKWATEQWTDYRVESSDEGSCRVTVGQHIKFGTISRRAARKFLAKERETHLRECRDVLECLTASGDAG